MEKAQTGIEGLDILLEGGLKRNGNYVVIGEYGTGKTNFGLEFLYNGAVKYDEPGVFIAVEEKKDKILENAKAFGWDLAKLEKQDKIRLVSYLQPVIDGINFEISEDLTRGPLEKPLEYLTVQALLSEIKLKCTEINAKRVVIDSITALNMLMPEEVKARMNLLYLLYQLGNLDITSVITVEKSKVQWGDIMFLADGVIELDYIIDSGIAFRGLTVKKMRGASHKEGSYIYKITGKGLKIMQEVQSHTSRR
ncbi:MAG: ATPase domain-containing protein [Candidatus Altiarchaeota archaeon]